jgi:hypothetical protein
MKNISGGGWIFTSKTLKDPKAHARKRKIDVFRPYDSTFSWEKMLNFHTACGRK